MAKVEQLHQLWISKEIGKRNALRDPWETTTLVTHRQRHSGRFPAIRGSRSIAPLKTRRRNRPKDEVVSGSSPAATAPHLLQRLGLVEQSWTSPVVALSSFAAAPL